MNPSRVLFISLIGFCSVYCITAFAASQEFELRIREHLFYPSNLEVPANQKIRLVIINEDATPEEFESYELNREKVIFIGPLSPGEYVFFGEFYPRTAQGKIIAR